MPETPVATETAPVTEWIVTVPHKEVLSLSREKIPREQAAWTTSDDWAIFAIHGNYVRPVRDYGWYPGTPCRLRSFASGRMFELPPGSGELVTSLLI